MPITKRVGTRELLRNFKSLKEMLTQGEVHFVVIDLGEEKELELCVRHAPSSGASLAQMFESMPKKYRIRRTDLFENLFQ